MSKRAVRVWLILLQLIGLGGLLTGRPAWAQADQAPPPGELWELRARYGVAIRSGTERDEGPGLSYGGFSPDELAIGGWVWPLLSRHLGLAASVEREGFGLYDGSTRVTSGGLFRAAAGPGGRVLFGPLSLDLTVSYSYAQLPVFGTVTTPAFSLVTRHSVLPALRALVDLGPVTLEGRFEYAIPLAVQGRSASAFGIGAGGGVRVRLVQAAALDFGILLDAAWTRDSLSSLAGASELSSVQNVVRGTVGLDLKWKEPRVPAPDPGALALTVLVDGAPATQAVHLELPEGPRDLTTDAAGSLAISGLKPGPLTARAQRPGYLDAQASGEVSSGGTLALALSLVKPPPTVGTLAVHVVSKDGAKPLAGAIVSVGASSQPTDAAGAAAFGELPPGPVAVKVTLADFNAGDEAASIIAGKTTELSVTLVPVKKRVPATVSGLVRSARGGAPVAARLELRELKKTIEADARGAFSLEVPGGKYTVRIAAEGFLTQTKVVTVRDGDQAIFNVDLFPK